VYVSVLIHPTLANGRNEKALREMEMKHCIRATATGHFIHASGKKPELRATKPARHTEFDHSPFGGDAA